MNSDPVTLTLIPGAYAICRLDPGSTVPVWAIGGSFFSITRTPEELSIVCESGVIPGGIQAESGWRVLGVQGPLDFSLTGIVAGLTTTLASAAISCFALSTYDTDYLLVHDADLTRAIQALRNSGHTVSDT